MLQFKEYDSLTNTQISELIDQIDPILKKRKRLHELYARKKKKEDIVSDVNSTTVLPFEKMLTDLATGYTSGKPTYTVNVSLDQERNTILEKYLKKKIINQKQAKEMEEIIKYITNFNDDETENRELIHDLFEMRACYEIVYENKDNEIVYARYSPLQTIATWDYNIPANITGLLRLWREKDIDGTTVDMLEVIDSKKKRTFRRSGEAITVVSEYEHAWGDVPAIAVETEFAFFEIAEDMIAAYEGLVESTTNTFKYNDKDAKLVIKGYKPKNTMLVQNDDGTYAINPKRAAEDAAMAASKTFYINDDGDVKYILKPIDAQGTSELMENYLDLIFQLSCIPNTNDLAFNSTDLNASAIDRKFYIMDMNTSNAISQLKKAYLRRWELIFNRVNLKSNLGGEAKFDFRNIIVDIPKNLPTNRVEMADFLLKLNGKISDKTIVETLGFDYLAEMQKKKTEVKDTVDNEDIIDDNNSGSHDDDDDDINKNTRAVPMKTH